MGLETTSLKIVHSVLKLASTPEPKQTPYEFPESMEMSGKSEDPDDQLKKQNALKYPSIQLPKPFMCVDFVVRRSFATYDAFFVFYSKDARIFRGVSDIFSKKLRGKNLEFSDFNNNNGVGIVIDPLAKNGERCLVGLMSPEPKGRVRDIGIGCNGAYPREFNNSFSDWVMDIKDPIRGLEPIANMFLESCYENYNRKPFQRFKAGFSGFRPVLPTHPIYLNL